MRDREAPKGRQIGQNHTRKGEMDTEVGEEGGELPHLPRCLSPQITKQKASVKGKARKREGREPARTDRVNQWGRVSSQK